MTAFTIDAADLTEVCNWVGRIVPARPTTPSLGGLLLEANDELTGDGDDGQGAEGTLTVRGYDNDTAATAVVPAVVTTPGTLLVSARLLSSISAALSAGRRPVRLSVEVRGTRAHLTAGRSEWTLPTMDPALYPPLPALGERVGVIEAARLARGIGQVLPAAANDLTQVSICGVRVEADAHTLTLAATDRYRIAAVDLDWTAKDTTAGPDAEGLLLAETLPLALLDLVRVAFAEDEQVDVHIGSGIGFAGERRTVIGRPIAEQFLPWRRKLSADDSHWVTLDTVELTYALDQALALGETTVALDFTRNGEVEVSADGEVGTARALSPVTELVGAPLRLTLNAGFLRDGVLACLAPSVKVHLGDSGRHPILLVDALGGTFRYLTIPIRA